MKLPFDRAAAKAACPALDFGGPVDHPFEPFPESALKRSVWDRFERVARNNPRRLATADPDREMTYEQLAAFAGNVRDALGALLPPEPGPVAILLENEARYPGVMLGILAAGHICVPLDADHPAERNLQIAEHAGAIGVVSAGLAAGRARELFPAQVPVLSLRDLPQAPRRRPRRVPEPDDAACIIYTSGSTGVPKGVYQNHRGVLHDVMQSINTAHISAEDRISLMYSQGFIAGLRTTFSALLNGASLHALSPQKLGPHGIIAEIARRKLTCLRGSPSLFRGLADGLSDGQQLDSVRLVLLGGERIDWSDFDLVRRICGPRTQVTVNLGATECWTIHTQWFVDESKRVDGVCMPVGHAIADRPVRLIREDGSEAEPGEIGELAVSSRYNALGYWRAPELTARAFTPDPADPQSRIYRTGDLGRRRPDGLLECVGRKDQQIKISGKRVEPGEVEAALRGCRGVKDAAVLVRSSDPMPPVLTAWVECLPGHNGLLPRHFKAMLYRKLPRHMIPAHISMLPELPRLPSFKVDRIALARLDTERAAEEREKAPDPVLEQTTAIFKSVLDVSQAAPGENLASLGGDSLQAISLALELEQHFGVPVPMEKLEATESIAQLASWIKLEVRRAGRTRRKAASHGTAPPSLPELAETLDRLLQQGDLEAAAAESQRLQSLHPEAVYGSNVRSVLKKLPPIDDSFIPYIEDRTRDLEIVARPGADTVLLVFTGRRDRIGIPLPLAHRWLGRMPASIVYLRDFAMVQYLEGVTAFGKGREATLDGLRALFGRLGARRVLCIGTSSGTMAAMQYGLDLKAEAVVGMGSPINFDREFNMYLNWAGVAARMREQFGNRIIDLRAAYQAADNPPRTLLICADNNWDDRLQFEYMQGARNVQVSMVANSLQHVVTMALLHRDWFEPMLDWLFDPAAPDFPEMVPESTAAEAEIPPEYTT